MNIIVLIGKPDGKILSQTLFDAFKNQGGAALISYSSANFCKSFETIIYETEKIKKISAENGVLIFKNGCKILDPLEVPDGFTAIVDSSNSDALAMLGKHNIPVITCSKSCDTLCFSSVDKKNAMISLQREITSFSGKITEPCEIAISSVSSKDMFSPLAAAAALLLFDKKIKF
ncbi:MAG: hypothetical protein ACI4QV_01210 [Acutalibacteraceae bacterium]